MTNQQNIVHTMVSEIMTPYLVTIDQYATLAEAHEKMKMNKIRRLPVTGDDSLIGIITERDILNAKPADIKHSLNEDEINESLSKIIVEVVMTKKPVAIYQTDTIGHAAEKMLEDKVGGLPVLDANKKLIGLITESDIFRAIAKRWRDDNELFSGVD